jgi:hypothetical protein
MNAAPMAIPKVRGFVLVVARDGRVKVDDWNSLTADEQRQIAEYVVAHYPRGHEHGCNA